MPECVPKYVTDLIIPPPMDVNSAGSTQVRRNHRGMPSAGPPVLASAAADGISWACWVGSSAS